jgi:hypothetical protein
MLPTFMQDVLSLVRATLWNPMALQTTCGCLPRRIPGSPGVIEETAAHA